MQVAVFLDVVKT